MTLHRPIRGALFAILLFLAQLILPPVGAAATVTVSELRPGMPIVGPITIATNVGGAFLDPLSINNTFTLPIPPFLTPDGNFLISGKASPTTPGTVTATNLGGFAVGLVLSFTVTDVGGVPGDIQMDVTQLYQVSSIPPQIVGALLAGTFIEAAPVGHQVTGQALTNRGALPPVSASDLSGAAFAQATFQFLAGPPSFVDLFLDFSFAPGVTAGDAISIPFTFAQVTAIPEPSTALLVATGLLGLLGYVRFRKPSTA